MQKGVLKPLDEWPSVVERIGTLETYPHLGHLGRVHGTHEIAFPPLPFVAAYEVRDDA